MAVLDLVNRKWSLSTPAKVDVSLDNKVIQRKSRHIDWNYVKEELESVLADPEDIVSMEQLAKRMGYAKRLLYQHWPRQCKQIARRYTEKLRNSKEKNIQDVRSEVRFIGESLMSSGRHPSRRSIESLASKPGILRSSSAQQEWAALLHQSSVLFE